MSDRQRCVLQPDVHGSKSDPSPDSLNNGRRPLLFSRSKGSLKNREDVSDKGGVFKKCRSENSGKRGKGKRRRSQRLGLDKSKHTYAGRVNEEEYQAPTSDRLQHASFDHMAPPGAWNTKPCDYPKHTPARTISFLGGLSESFCCQICTIFPSFCARRAPIVTFHLLVCPKIPRICPREARQTETETFSVVFRLILIS